MATPALAFLHVLRALIKSSSLGGSARFPCLLFQLLITVNIKNIHLMSSASGFSFLRLAVAPPLPEKQKAGKHNKYHLPEGTGTP